MQHGGQCGSGWAFGHFLCSFLVRDKHRPLGVFCVIISPGAGTAGGGNLIYIPRPLHFRHKQLSLAGSSGGKKEGSLSPSFAAVGDLCLLRVKDPSLVAIIAKCTL